MVGFAQLIMAAGGTDFNLSGATIADFDGTGDTATVELRVKADGTVEAVDQSGTGQLASETDWVRPQYLAPGSPEGGGLTNVTVRATLQSGDPLTAGTVDTWLSLTTDRSWTLQQIGDGSKSSTLLIEIGGTNNDVLASASYVLNVDVATV